MDIFTFQSYKAVLRASIKENQSQRGYKSQLAEAAGCQRAYLSQTLNSHVQLTPEHALNLADFWGLPALEKEFFIELVNYERAGSEKLRQYSLQRLTKFREKNSNISLRLKKPGIQDPSLQVSYYSSWHFSAIHILLTIPGYNTVESLAKKINLREDVVRQALGTLKALGLVKQNGPQWTSVSFDLHLSKDSPMNTWNHSNWRQRAVLDSQSPNSQGTHFTSVYSMSQSDFEKLKGELLKFIERSRQLALASPEEKLVSFTCDLFAVC